MNKLLVLILPLLTACASNIPIIDKIDRIECHEAVCDTFWIWRPDRLAETPVDSVIDMWFKAHNSDEKIGIYGY
jgi:hypothetical protein